MIQLLGRISSRGHLSLTLLIYDKIVCLIPCFLSASIYDCCFLAFGQVSAKNGRGVEDVFLQMSRTMSEKQNSKAAAGAGAGGRKKGRDIVTVIDEPSADAVAASKGGCC